MKKSKFETSWSLPWQELLETCNDSFGLNYKSQPAILRYMYYNFNQNITDMANFLGVGIASLRKKLIEEGVHKVKKYNGTKKIGVTRKFIREAPDDFFIDMNIRDIRKMFPNINTSHVCKMMRAEGKVWDKRWYWAKSKKKKKEVIMANMKETMVLTALQIAYEYPDWGPEHVSDMYDTFKVSGRKVTFDVDDLHDMTIKANNLKEQGMEWKDAENELMGRK
jgi:hypothetical protein